MGKCVGRGEGRKNPLAKYKWDGRCLHWRSGFKGKENGVAELVDAKTDRTLKARTGGNPFVGTKEGSLNKPGRQGGKAAITPGGF